MKNVVIFGAVQSGKSTLMGYIESASLSDKAFSDAALRRQKIIREMGIGSIKTDMILPSFISLDRDELMDFSEKNSPGTSKRIHRKKISISVEGNLQSNKYTFIDTPGSRDRYGEQYAGMFEGELGICVMSAIDLNHYFSLDFSSNPEKKRSEERRLFEPIHFWSVYKGSKNLVIVLSKSDYFSNDPDRLHEIYEQLCLEIINICSHRVLIIPTSIRLIKQDGVYIRRENNIFEKDNAFSWYSGPSLIDELTRQLQSTTFINSTKFQLAACIKICLIPNTANYALRIKCVQGTLSQDDTLILGPILNKEKVQVFLGGTVKSLKIEDAQITRQLEEGTIGGIAFNTLYTKDSRHDNQSLENYRILPTTVLMAGNYVTGNAVRVRIKEDELGDSTIEALLQILPKAQLQFYWLGKPIMADLIEHYEKDGYLYFSFANLSDITTGDEKQFALPVCEEKIPYIECPVTMEYNEYRVDKKIEKLRVKTNALFHVNDIFSIDNKQTFVVVMIVEDCFLDNEDIERYFALSNQIIVKKKGHDQLVITISGITNQTAHKCYKLLREFAVLEGVTKYQLRLCQQDSIVR